MKNMHEPSAFDNIFHSIVFEFDELSHYTRHLCIDVGDDVLAFNVWMSVLSFLSPCFSILIKRSCVSFLAFFMGIGAYIMMSIFLFSLVLET